MLDKAIALDQSYITAYGNKVNLLLSEEEYDQAIKTLDEAIKIQSGTTWILSFES